MPNETAIFVDGNYQLHRCWRTLGAHSGIPEKRVPLLILDYFCSYALEYGAKFGSLCFDGNDIFRYRVYADYKKNRRDTSSEVFQGGGQNVEGRTKNEVKDQIYRCLQPTARLFDLLGLPCHQNAELEADDLTASGAYAFTRDLETREYRTGRKAYIVSPDKDSIQRIDKQVLVLRPGANKQPNRVITLEEVLKEKGMNPRQFADYQALVGDSIDDIPAILTPAKAKAAILGAGSLKKFLGTSEGQKFWRRYETEIRRNVQLVRLHYRSWLPSDEELRFFSRPYNRKSVMDEYGKLPSSFLALELAGKKKSLF